MRLTATYAVSSSLSLGVEWNPLAEDIGVLANWRALDETESRPALVFGTSSDRIGSASGRAYYGTLSKDLEAWTGLPVAPYAGVTYGEFEDELRFIGGLNIRWSERWASAHLWDGVNLHHVVDRQLSDSTTFGVVAAEQEGSYYLGIRVSVSP